MDKQIKAQQFADEHYNGVRKLCKCGCGQQTNYNSRLRDLADFIKGHAARTDKNPTKGTKGTERAKEYMRKAYEKRKSDLHSGEVKQWNKGKTAKTDERVKAYSEKQIGKAVTDEFRENQSKVMIDRIARMKEEGTYDSEFNQHMKEYWKDPAHREEQRYRTTERLLRDNYSGKTSLAESNMRQILDDLGITYVHQKNIKGKLFDFVIGKTIIEVDGDFYHARPEKWPNGPEYPIQIKTVENDKIKNEIAKEQSYNLIRIWATEVNTSETLKKIKGIQ